MQESERSDQEHRWCLWMTAAQGGDGAAYEKLLLEILPLVRAQVAMRVREVAERDDIVQNVLMSIHRARHTYRSERPFVPWLRAVVRNATIDWMRARGRRSRWEQVGDPVVLADAVQVAPEVPDDGGTLDDQIHELARELRPVRPVPRLRVVVAAAMALGLVVLAAHWLLGGPGLRPGGSGVRSVSYLTTLAGLAISAIGAILAALASAVPARDGVARTGMRATVGGLALAVAGGLWGLLRTGVGAEPISECLECIGRAVVLGAAPVLLTCAFVAYAVVRRPAPESALALVGGVSLGAVLVHATCPLDSPMHWLVGHTLAPVLAAAALTGPLALLLARAKRGV